MGFPTIEVEFDGSLLLIAVDDFDSIEWHALKLATGLRMFDVIDDIRHWDPYAIAGLVWMRMRRDTPDLPFEDVATRVNASHALRRTDGDDDVRPAEVRRRRQILQYLPSLAAVFNVRPWEVDLLTSAEVAEFLDFLNQLNPAPPEVIDG